jgi:hypothetical protein
LKDGFALHVDLWVHDSGDFGQYCCSEKLPAGAKARVIIGSGGTAEAVPFPKPIVETSMSF